MSEVKLAKIKLNNVITKMTLNIGFDDVKFLKSKRKNEAILLLFKSYTPSKTEDDINKIGVSEYYPCSNTSHFLLKDFMTKLIEDLKIETTVVKDIYYKDLARRCGGITGLNTIYYHEKFGSYVCIQALYIKADVEVQKDKEHNDCEKCYACIKNCPTFAINKSGFTREKCLREMISGVIPEKHRKAIYQLMGCDKCQTCCPMNNTELKEPILFDVLEVIKGEKTKEIKALCGSNYGKRTRSVAQAICYAASKNNKNALNKISKLTDDSSDIIAEYARWASKELG